MSEFGGVYPPIATPFDAQGALDVAALAANVAKWRDIGLSGFVVGGSNGESAMLSKDEVAVAVATVRKHALPGQKVIAGTGRESTADTIELTQMAANAGADAALVVTPHFYGSAMTHDALVGYYSTVADASPIPVLIYNVPKFTHLNIAVETVAELATHENIVGIKDSAGMINQIIAFVAACPPEFEVLVGNGPAFLPGLVMGAVGGILALANVAPAECVEIKRLYDAGDLKAARAMHFRMMPVNAAVTSRFGVPGLKACLDALGYQGGAPRPPILPADAATQATCRSILEQAGLLT